MPYVLLLLAVLLLWECSALLQIRSAAWRVVFVAVGGIAFFKVTTMTQETFLRVFGHVFVVNLSYFLMACFCLWVASTNWMNQFRVSRSKGESVPDAPAFSVNISSASRTAKFTLSIGCLFVLTVLCVALYGLHEYVGPGVLLYVLGVAWATDTGAYFIGRSFGKRPLSRLISPKKTVEGTIGGCIVGTTIALIFGFAWLKTEMDWSNLGVVTMSFAVPLAAVVGDLLESVLKRISDAKDSGSILSGHGGLLDRIDSLLIAAPTMFVISVLFRVSPQ